jgi:hypothetical protein
MCLACEMDAWWFAEMEAKARATTPGTAGVPPALQGSSPSATPGSLERAGGSKVGLARLWHFKMSKSATADFDPAVPGAPFACEETRSE